MKKPQYLFPLIIISLVSILSCKPENDETKNENCDTCIIAYKPNIYIYPEIPMHLLVELNFPKGGKIIASEPEYYKGWSIFADTNGMIDYQYQYLFYESYQANIWQTKQGWVIAQNNLKPFFEQNMKNAGFIASEIKDFTDYWIPILSVAPYYIIYPQQKTIIDQAIELKLSKEPDQILRLFYLIEGTENKIELPIPEIYNPIDRYGFTVAEWGVLMK